MPANTGKIAPATPLRALRDISDKIFYIRIYIRTAVLKNVFTDSWAKKHISRFISRADYEDFPSFRTIREKIIALGKQLDEKK